MNAPNTQGMRFPPPCTKPKHLHSPDLLLRPTKWVSSPLTPKTTIAAKIQWPLKPTWFLGRPPCASSNCRQKLSGHSAFLHLLRSFLAAAKEALLWSVLATALTQHGDPPHLEGVPVSQALLPQNNVPWVVFAMYYGCWCIKTRVWGAQHHFPPLQPRDTVILMQLRFFPRLPCLGS